MIYSVLRRTLREGVGFDEFRTAWKPPEGLEHADFQVLHARSISDEREILSIGVHDMTVEDFVAFASSDDFARVNEARHAKIAPLVVEQDGFIGAYELIEGDQISL